MTTEAFVEMVDKLVSFVVKNTLKQAELRKKLLEDETARCPRSHTEAN